MFFGYTSNTRYGLLMRRHSSYTESEKAREKAAEAKSEKESKPAAKEEKKG